MMKKTFTDEKLMAFADGELNDAECAEIEAALAEDDELMARVAMFMETRARAKEALGPLLDAPVPDELQSSVEALVKAHEAQPAGVPFQSDTVIPFRKPAQENTTQTPWYLRRDLAAAATVALCIGGVAGFGLSGFQSSRGAVDTRTATAVQTIDFSEPGLAEALESVESGTETMLGDTVRFRAIASFRDDGGNFCREIEIDENAGPTVVAVVCDEADNWNVRFTVVAASADNGYAPASSLEALDAYLTAVGATSPMTESEERETLRAR